MCMDPSLTGFYMMGQKLSDVILVLRITPIEQLSRLPFLFFSASSSAIAYVRHRTAHILALSHPGWLRGFHWVGQKVRKNRIFDHFENLRLHISATVMQHTEKCFIHPLSNCRMCMDPSPTGFYRVVQKVSDVIPVLGIMSRLPFLFS